MKKNYLFGISALIVLLLCAVPPVAAGKPVLNPDNTPYLVAKNMAAGWVENEDLGIGRFSYPNRGADLAFDAQNLTAGPVDYAMISYREPVDGAFLSTVHNLLKLGTSRENGTLHMKIGTGAFLNHLICNTYGADAPGDYRNVTGAKVWLVPVSDLSIDEENGTAVFTAWNPSGYLFESDLITQTCTVSPKDLRKNQTSREKPGVLQNHTAPGNRVVRDNLTTHEKQVFLQNHDKPEKQAPRKK